VVNKGVCPKCGREGTRSITYKPSVANPKQQYLSFIHSENDRCFIGRIRTSDEVMGELNRPETKEEYEAALEEMAKEIRALIDSYSGSGIGSVKRILKILDGILVRHGY
jgi:hypothetical protein